jgi:hypothetical protein
MYSRKTMLVDCSVSGVAFWWPGEEEEEEGARTVGK